MTSVRVIFSQITAKKVPALAMVFIAIVGMVVGVAMAAFTIGSFTNTFSEGGATYTPNAPTGVTFTNAGSNLASQTSPSSATQCTSVDASTSSLPDNLVGGSTIYGCLNNVASTGYPSSDTIEYATVSWSTSAPVSTTYELSVYYGGATSSPVNIFVKTPATLSASASALITFDLTKASVTSVTSVEVLVHQCSGSTCP